jgi:hypothetical protein
VPNSGKKENGNNYESVDGNRGNSSNWDNRSHNFITKKETIGVATT